MKTKILIYKGHVQKTFEIKKYQSTDPRRKFECNPNDTFIFGFNIEEKNAMWLAQRYQSDFNITERAVTKNELVEIRINELVVEYGNDIVYDVFEMMFMNTGEFVQKEEKVRKKKKNDV